MGKRAPSELEHFVLLALMHLGGEGYGVTVRDEIERRTGKRPSLAAVYGVLARLEEKGLASSWTSDPVPERGGRAKRHYRVEPSGVEAARAARERMERMWRGLDAGEPA